MNKRQRNKIYKNALEFYEAPNYDTSCYLCWAISIAERGYKGKLNFDLYPEFTLFTPTEDGVYPGAWYAYDSEYNNMGYMDKAVKDHQILVLMFCKEMTK